MILPDNSGLWTLQQIVSQWMFSVMLTVLAGFYYTFYNLPVRFIPRRSLCVMTASCLGVYLFIGGGFSSVVILYHVAEGDSWFTQKEISCTRASCTEFLSRFFTCCKDGCMVYWTLSMNLVDFASSSTFSLLSMPMWLGIQFRVTVLLFSLCW